MTLIQTVSPSGKDNWPRELGQSDSKKKDGKVETTNITLPKHLPKNTKSWRRIFGGVPVFFARLTLKNV